MRSRLLPAALFAAATLVLALPAMASAAVFNVNVVGGNDLTCSPCATIQQGIDTALLAGSGNTVSVAAGTYAPFHVDAGQAVVILGAGTTKTFVADDDSFDFQPAVALNGSGATLRNLAITGSDETELTVNGGTVAGVKVTNTDNSNTAVRVTPTVSTVSLLDVTAVAPTTNLGTAIQVDSGSFATTIMRTYARGARAVHLTSNATGAVTLRQVTAYGGTNTVLDDSSGARTVKVYDSLLASIVAGADAVTLSAGTTAGSWLLDGVTAVVTPAAASGSAHGVSIFSTDSDARTVSVKNTIFSGFTAGDIATDYTNMATPSGLAIDVSYSRLDAGHEHSHTGGDDIAPTFGLGNLTTTPGFVNPTTGDFRLRTTSGLIDRGAPGALPAGRPTLDIRGYGRLRDGNVDLVTRIDMGAWELQSVPKLLSRPRVLPPVLRAGSGASCDPGRWRGGTGTLSVIWLRGKHRVPHATTFALQLKRSWTRSRIRCRVTYTTTDASVSATSASRKVKPYVRPSHANPVTVG